MKNYLVIGSPINHSLSPKLHNYWIKKYNIPAFYDKKELNLDELSEVIKKVKNEDINGINVTVPYKKKIISLLDELSPEAQSTQSVNTIYLEKNKIKGHNTDIHGFESAIKNTNFDISNKRVLILGAGGVVSSIIFALNKMKVSEIIVANRTKLKAENLKNMFKYIKIVDWGKIPDFDMIINATSIGLKDNDILDLDFSKIKNGKLFFDVIYNPKETNFLKTGKKLGNDIENGKKMFIYQAAAAFNIWNGIYPEINEEVSHILD